jgi:hypothetical protein
MNCAVMDMTTARVTHTLFSHSAPKPGNENEAKVPDRPPDCGDPLSAAGSIG